MYRSFRSLLKLLLTTSLLLLSLPVYAGMNEATKAYIRGDFSTARYEALIGATDGDPAAQMLMGQLYFNGEGVEKNLDLAMYWYQQAATNGFMEAQFRLGELFFNGITGIEKNYNKAWDWLTKADVAGHDKTEPMLELLYKQEDTGQVVNLNESPEVLKIASDKGVLKAQYLLASNLIKAGGAPTDRTTAIELMTIAAKKGFIKAQKRLGEWYLQGLGVEKNYIEAYGWSMAYAGTKELGGIIREGKQTARTSLRNLAEEQHNDAYVRSREYFEQYVLPFHGNAREVGPDKYRIVVRSKVTSANPVQSNQPSTQKTAALQSQITQATISQAQKTPAQTDQNPSATGTAATSATNSAIGATAVNAAAAVSNAAASSVAPTESENQQPAQPDRPGTLSTPPDNRETEHVEKQAPGQLTSEVGSGQSTDKQDAVSVEKMIETPNTDKLDDTAQTQGNALDNAVVSAVEPQAEPVTETEQQPLELTDKTVVGDTDKSHKDNVSNGNQSLAPASPPAPESVLALKSSPANGANTVNTTEDKERSAKDVSRKFETFLSKIQELHLRAFQLDKTVQGRMTIMLHIEPDGSVSKVELSSSEIESLQFEQDLTDLLKTLNFGAQKAPKYLFTHQADFLPQ